jgi:hypothetical protein
MRGWGHALVAAVVAVLAVAVVAAVACGRPATVGLAAAGRSTMPVPVGVAGGVFTLRLVNDGSADVRVGGIEAEADPDLTVQVYGLTDCRLGCVGAGLADAEGERQATRSVAARLAVVPRESRGGGVSVVVALRWRDPAARHPCRRLRALSVATPRGSLRLTGPDGGWLAGVYSDGAAGGC